MFQWTLSTKHDILMFVTLGWCYRSQRRWIARSTKTATWQSRDSQVSWKYTKNTRKFQGIFCDSLGTLKMNEHEILKAFDTVMRPSFHNNSLEWKRIEHSIGKWPTQQGIGVSYWQRYSFDIWRWEISSYLVRKNNLLMPLRVAIATHGCHHLLNSGWFFVG